jgi:hypothetical protein
MLEATRTSERSARHEALTLAAYHDALRELSSYRHDPGTLLARLGDVDRQAAHTVTDIRLALAGRLIAAAQVAERVRLPEPAVHALVRAWLTTSAAEREDAAPARAPRVTAEVARDSGFARSLLESQRDGRFSRAAWKIAGAVLQQLIRPTTDRPRALSSRDALQPLADAALELLDPEPADPPDGPAHRVLATTAMRVREAAQVLQNAASGRPERRDAWLQIAASVAGGRARWSSVTAGDSMADGLARATERLASSLLPEQPERFPQEDASEQAVQAAYDAAVTTLGLAVHPGDPIFVHSKPDVLESLLEAQSSGLIGAWVVVRMRS